MSRQSYVHNVGGAAKIRRPADSHADEYRRIADHAVTVAMALRDGDAAEVLNDAALSALEIARCRQVTGPNDYARLNEWSERAGVRMKRLLDLQDKVYAAIGWADALAELRRPGGPTGQADAGLLDEVEKRADQFVAALPAGGSQGKVAEDRGRGWKPARWFREATDDGLNSDAMRAAMSRGKIVGHKPKGGRQWHYKIADVCAVWPQYADFIESHYLKLKKMRTESRTGAN